METSIDHIDFLLEKRSTSSFHFTCENTAELKDSLESLLSISNYDLLSIKGSGSMFLKSIHFLFKMFAIFNTRDIL